MSWPTMPLGEVATLQRGFDLPSQNRLEGTIPIYAANGPVGFHNEMRVAGPGVVTGRSGSIGKVHYVDSGYWPLNTSLYVKDFHGNDPKYIYWLLRSMHLERFHHGTGVPTLNRNVVHRELVTVPPLPEQRRIAAILDKADALRAKRREAIAKLDQLLQSVFLEMFGTPVTNPKGWPISRLADLGTLDRGVSRQRPRGAPGLLGGEHPLIQTGDVARSGGYIREFTATYSDAGLAQSKKWPAGTLCITIAANIADTGILTFDACFPDSVVGFTANQNGNAEFIQMLMNFLREILEEKAPKVAQKNINLAILRELPIPVPPIELQREWGKFAVRVEHMKQSLRAATACSDKLFGSIQQNAFAGTL